MMKKLRIFGCLDYRRRQTLAISVFVTSFSMMLLNHQMSHYPVPQDAKTPQGDVSYPLNPQEEELLSKLKAIMRVSIRNEMKDVRDKLAVISNRDDKKGENVKHPSINFIPEGKNVVEGRNLEPVAKEIKTNNEMQEIKKIHNASQYPPHLHPDRFKFIYKNERISTDGPKVNPIPEKLAWTHDVDPSKVCRGNDTFILAIVISALNKKGMRHFIRRTWANPRLFPYTKMRYVFIVGGTTNKMLQDEVDAEYDIYEDMIQYNFIDSYETLTYKSLAWLKWVGERCPHVPFIAKIDDDVMVNPFHLKTFFEEQMRIPPVPAEPSGTLHKDILEPGENIATAYIYGRFDGVPYPLRYTKWGVTKEEFPEKNYPPFVHGPAYVVGRAAARTMLKYAPYVPFLKLEDVYTTGLVAHAAQVKHVQINGVVNTFLVTSKLFNGTQALLEETNDKSRRDAWEGIALHAPVNIEALGTPWT
ncbi:beta-1,3-galactosyltransferase 9-like [Palaemon carinicauda]|uniref:beta-1,3-galactosyltransferase 9-like n=1 Tax=Palaemon carinicauda TaxID=392227 RepID=UPI0035B657C6